MADVKIGNVWGKINIQAVVVSMENNNNNSNTYTKPKKSQSEINSCKAMCVSNESICSSNCAYLTTAQSQSDNKYSCLHKCKKARESCEFYCKN